MFLINHQHLQDYFIYYNESWNIYFLSEFSSELSCLSSTKKNEKKWHDISNWNSMHSHQKKTLLEKIKLLNFSYYCNLFQVFICKLNSILNLKHRKCVKQIIKSHKKEASLQMKNIMNSQKISLKENKNIKINSQNAQII